MTALTNWSGIFRLNEVIEYQQFNADIVALSGGGFAATWMSRTGAWTTDAFSDALDIHARIFSAAGAALDDDIVVHASAGADWFPRATALDDGGFAVAWDAFDYTTRDHVRLRSFDADGAPGLFDIALPGRGQHAEVTTLEDGSIALTWQPRYLSGSFYVGGDVKANVWAPDTSVTIADLIPGPTGEAAQQQTPTIAGLEGGGFLVAWVDTRGRDGDDLGLFGQRVSARGELVGERIAVTEATAGRQFEADSLGLPGGGFVLSWSSPDGDGYGVWARVFDAAGTPRTGDIPLNTTTGFDQRDSALTALPDGGFLAVWSSQDQGLVARSFAADGTATGPEHLVVDWFRSDFDGAWAPTSRPSVAALDDGRIVVAADQGAVLDGDVYARFLDTRSEAVNLAGTAGADVLVGTVFGDRLDGGAGSDTISGGDGADTIIGGTGDDLIFGGETAADLRDRIFAGDGNDRVDAGHGNDEVYGGDGNDTVQGGFGVDTLIGGAGDDVLTGGAWSDLIFGGDGNDFINGGFGSDRVNGGVGADRFYHLGIPDHGSDWIQDYSAAQGDVLVWGGGAATRAQFQVNVTETANAGQAGVQEAFVIYRPTGQILWALVDGGAQGAINLQIGGQVFDLLA